MEDNPFLALFESSAPAQNSQRLDQPVTTKSPNNLEEPKAQINHFYERIFSFTINNDLAPEFDVIYLEGLADGIQDGFKYLTKDIIGQAICERIFYYQDDLKNGIVLPLGEDYPKS